MHWVRKYPNSAALRKHKNSQKRSFLWSFVIFLISSESCNNYTLDPVYFILGKGFMKGASVFGKQKKLLGRSSSSVRRRPHAAKIAGSNPARPIFFAVLLLYWRIKRFIKYYYLRYCGKLRGHINGKQRQVNEPYKWRHATFLKLHQHKM
jgi:hypothetical protein